jgi:hypothetical protein
MSKAKDNLIAARALIADKAHWTQGTYARDELGLVVSPIDADATCFCAMGALYRADHVNPNDVDDYLCPSMPGYLELAAAADGYAIPDINDGEVEEFEEDPHSAVLALYDRAIAAAP